VADEFKKYVEQNMQNWLNESGMPDTDKNRKTAIITNTRDKMAILHNACINMITIQDDKPVDTFMLDTHRIFLLRREFKLQVRAVVLIQTLEFIRAKNEGSVPLTTDVLEHIKTLCCFHVDTVLESLHIKDTKVCSMIKDNMLNTNIVNKLVTKRMLSFWKSNILRQPLNEKDCKCFEPLWAHFSSNLHKLDPIRMIELNADAFQTYYLSFFKDALCEYLKN
jgi:hypothetical protein